jgi:predicted anti-sigma-YlaC factor YlaD
MTATRELSCQEIVELVTEYVEGTMDGQLRVAFEAHLAACEGCVHYLEQIAATIRLAGTLEPEPLPPELEAGLLAAFRGFERPGRAPS